MSQKITKKEFQGAIEYKSKPTKIVIAGFIFLLIVYLIVFGGGGFN